MKKLKYCFLGLLATFSLGFYSCQNDDVSNSDLTGGSEEVFTVTEAVFTKGSTEILEGKGTYKTGETATLKAAAGATITGTRTRGTGTFGNTYQKDGYAWAEINDIHGDWVVSATLPDPKKYTVTVEAGTGGTVSGGGEVTEGSSCNISATENEGYAFNGWTVTSGTATIGNSNSMNTTVTPSSDCTITAQFVVNEQPKPSISVVFSYTSNPASSGNKLIATATLTSAYDKDITINVGCQIQALGVSGGTNKHILEDEITISAGTTSGSVVLYDGLVTYTSVSNKDASTNSGLDITCN